MTETSGRNVASKWVEAFKRRKSVADQEEHRSRVASKPVIFRAHSTLRELKQEHFDPSIVSLGLFDLFDDKKIASHSDIPTRKGDAFKLDVVMKFLADIHESLDSWQRISEEIVRETDKMKMLYDGHWNHDLLEEDIRSALALDAIFLASFLEYWSDYPAKWWRRTDEFFSRANMRTSVSMLQDTFKLENQIPLSLINNVIGIRCRYYQASAEWSRPSDNIFNEICYRYLERWRGRFPSSQLLDKGIDFCRCHHLLHCQAQLIWNSAESSSSPESARLTMSDPRDMQSRDRHLIKHLPRAKDLRQYGIDFEGQDAFFPRFEQHRFFFWKATLFLPKIEQIDRRTEVIWRNLLAFEDAFHHAASANDTSFGQYLGFMDLLIDDADDMLALCTEPNPVIARSILADNSATANLFNSIMKGQLLPHHEQWSTLEADIVHFHNRSFRRKIVKFTGIYSDEPWLVVSLIVASILLLLTFLQTYYTIKSSTTTPADTHVVCY